MGIRCEFRRDWLSSGLADEIAETQPNPIPLTPAQKHRVISCAYTAYLDRNWLTPRCEPDVSAIDFLALPRDLSETRVALSTRLESQPTERIHPVEYVSSICDR